MAPQPKKPEKPRMVIRLLMIGDSSVGKTSLVVRYEAAQRRLSSARPTRQVRPELSVSDGSVKTLYASGQSIFRMPPVKPPASAAVACTAIARWRGRSSAAACSPAATPGARRRRRWVRHAGLKYRKQPHAKEPLAFGQAPSDRAT